MITKQSEDVVQQQQCEPLPRGVHEGPDDGLLHAVRRRHPGRGRHIRARAEVAGSAMQVKVRDVLIIHILHWFRLPQFDRQPTFYLPKKLENHMNHKSVRHYYESTLQYSVHY